MDNNFTFPRPQVPVPRPPPVSSFARSSTDDTPPNRESNALRASVLDAALQLGIGTNSTVANWMFNNSLEEEEEEELRSPALTHGSTATSEESTRYPSTPSSSSHAYYKDASPHIHDISLDSPQHLTSATDFGKFDGPAVPATGSIAFPEIPIPPPPRPVTPGASGRGKLRKKRADGYESDGGYISEAGKKKDKDKRKDGSKDVSGGLSVEPDKKERAKEAKNRAKEEKIQEKKEKEEERKRKKSLVVSEKAVKKGQGQTDPTGRTSAGYETDAPSSKTKSKKVKSKPSGDAGYETDSGYLSSAPKKTKTRFFGLRTKQSKPDLHQEPSPTPSFTTIEKEPVPLPIASMFATTLGSTPVAGSSHGIVHSDANMSTGPPPPLPAITPSQPFNPSYESSVATITPYTPISPIETPIEHRGSYGSTESTGSISVTSGSSHPKRRGLHFFGHHENGRSGGNESYSTVTSAAQVPLPRSAMASPVSSAKSLNAISLPLTHTSPTSPASYPFAAKVDSSPRTQPSEAHSPTLYPPPALSNSDSRTPSPGPFLQVNPPTSATTSTPSPRLRPRFAPTDGFGPRYTPSPSPINLSPTYPGLPSPSPTPGTQSDLLHPHAPPQSASQPSRRAVPELTIVPSSAYLVPSPRGTPLPSPNTLAYYDIPPPSPPPSGPLPRVPPPGSFPRSRTQERTGGGSMSSVTAGRSRTPEPGLYSQPIPTIQRGRESPFPARPILPSGGSSGGSGTGLEARVRVPRYRELYGLALPRDHDFEQKRGSHMNGPGINVVEPTDDGWDEDGYDEQQEEGMRDVLDRFEEARLGLQARGRDRQGGTALGRSRSIEAKRRGAPAASGESDSEYYEDDGEELLSRKSSTEEGSGERSNRYSASIYSRASFLDPDKSEEARTRFVQRVEDMYGEGGREKNIPPVPKLPGSLAGTAAPPGRSWNRF